MRIFWLGSCTPSDSAAPAFWSLVRRRSSMATCSTTRFAAHHPGYLNERMRRPTSRTSRSRRRPPAFLKHNLPFRFTVAPRSGPHSSNGICLEKKIGWLRLGAPWVHGFTLGVTSRRPLEDLHRPDRRSHWIGVRPLAVPVSWPGLPAAPPSSRLLPVPAGAVRNCSSAFGAMRALRDVRAGRPPRHGVSRRERGSRRTSCRPDRA